jgi:Uma2 family endonuclease
MRGAATAGIRIHRDDAHCSTAKKVRELSRAPGKRLYDRIAPLLPPGYLVRKEDPLTLIDSEPEPDISVVKGAEADFFQAHPTTAEIVIEVSVSSPKLDREMASIYAEAQVKEYWIVLAGERTVEVYRSAHEGRYLEKQVFTFEDTVRSLAIPAIQIKIDDLFL